MTINRQLFITILFAGMAAGGPVAARADKAALAEIRQKYQAIEDGKTWVEQVISIDSEELTERKITRYATKDGVLQKLVVVEVNEDGTHTTRYYYSGGTVFFVFVQGEYQNFQWKLDESGEPRSQGAPQRMVREQRLYYVGGKCVQHLSKNAKAPGDGQTTAAALQKVPNVAVDDAATAEIYRKLGLALAGVRSQADLEASKVR